MRVLCSCDIYRYECRYVGNKLPVSALAGTVVLDIISKYHYFVRGMDISAFDMLYIGLHLCRQAGLKPPARTLASTVQCLIKYLNMHKTIQCMGIYRYSGRQVGNKPPLLCKSGG